jgi:hypothetical protein
MLLFVALINSFWFMSLMVQYSTNRHKEIAKVYILVNIIAVIVAIGACIVIGLAGVAWTLIVVEILMTLFVIPMSLNMVEDHWINFFRAIWSRPRFIQDSFHKRTTKIE